MTLLLSLIVSVCVGLISAYGTFAVGLGVVPAILVYIGAGSVSLLFSVTLFAYIRDLSGGTASRRVPVYLRAR